jgi:excisionase family DNA binding protein
MTESMLTVNDAAKRLAVQPETIRRWIRAGKLSAVALGTGRGNRLRIKPEVLERFIEQRQSTAEAPMMAEVTL